MRRGSARPIEGPSCLPPKTKAQPRKLKASRVAWLSVLCQLPAELETYFTLRSQEDIFLASIASFDLTRVRTRPWTDAAARACVVLFSTPHNRRVLRKSRITGVTSLHTMNSRQFEEAGRVKTNALYKCIIFLVFYGAGASSFPRKLIFFCALIVVRRLCLL